MLCFIVHLEDKRISISHCHSLLYQNLIDWNPNSLALFWSNLHRTWSCIIVIHRMAKFAIRHPYNTLSTNKSNTLVRSNQRFFCILVITHYKNFISRFRCKDNQFLDTKVILLSKIAFISIN